MQVWTPLLVVSTERTFGHAEGLHAVGAGMISDVVVELVSCYHPSGNGEAP